MGHQVKLPKTLEELQMLALDSSQFLTNLQTTNLN